MWTVPEGVTSYTRVLIGGGQGGDGRIIIYYRKKKELQSGPLVTSNNLGLLDSLGRRMIV